MADVDDNGDDEDCVGSGDADDGVDVISFLAAHVFVSYQRLLRSVFEQRQTRMLAEQKAEQRF